MTGHALMFEQDRLQGRINQLFERIEAQLRQVLKEKRYAMAKDLSMMNHCWPRNYWPSVKVCFLDLYALSFVINQPKNLMYAGH